MTVPVRMPICGACVHFQSFDRTHPTWWCSAFPKGIPEAIGMQAFDHRNPYPGDGGIRFLLSITKQAYLDAYDEQESSGAEAKALPGTALLDAVQAKLSSASASNLLNPKPIAGAQRDGVPSNDDEMFDDNDDDDEDDDEEGLGFD